MSSADIPELTIIVVSYNAATVIGPCLQSVYSHAGGVQVEVIVVDNDSDDDSADLVEQQFLQARVLRRKNRGFAAGNNAGLEVAKAPNILFLNPDTEIRAGTFAELLRYLKERPSVGLVGCVQVDEDGMVHPTIRRFPSVTRHLFEAVGSERFPFTASWLGERVLDLSVYERDTSCDWVSGSFMLTRREVITAAGGMDERYFLYCEEPDLCLRIKRLGWEVRHVPIMTILHYGDHTAQKEQLFAQQAYARRQYMLKNMSPWRCRLGTFALALGLAIRTVYLSLDLAEGRTRRGNARAALRILRRRVPSPFGVEANSEQSV